MNTQIIITQPNYFVQGVSERLDAPFYYEWERIVSPHRIVISKETDQPMPFGEGPATDKEQEPSTTSPPVAEAPLLKSAAKKRLSRTTRSFTCSAKDFVPRRTDDFCEHYDLGQLLGEGAFGEVFICHNKQTGDERAVKVIYKDRMIPSEYEEVVNEFQLLRQMDHPNVIRMFEFYDCQDKFYIVQELAEGGELYDELEAQVHLDEKETALLMKQVLSCLTYLHTNGCVHRDLNLENILLESKKDYEGLKIIDFGLAASCRDGEKLTELVGKIHYLAPEVLELQYDAKYDVWSAGVMAYILLSGFAPFEAEQHSDIRQLIMEGHVSFEDAEWDMVSEEAKDFVAKLLTYEVDSRPTAEEALRHPWIANAIKESSETFRETHSVLAEDALSNMKSFSNNSMLKQAACGYIASQLLHKEEREEIDRVFRGMDDDCDGRLSISDLQSKYREFNESELSEEEISALFHHCDMSGSGYIDYSEFVIASMRPSDLMDERKLQGCFDHFDVDKTGFISAEALRESLSNCRGDGEAWTDDLVDAIIRQVDGQGNGLISFQEFKDIMTQESQSDGSTERTEEDMLSISNEEDEADA